jgi:hypothetical protein
VFADFGAVLGEDLGSFGVGFGHGGSGVCLRFSWKWTDVKRTDTTVFLPSFTLPKKRPKGTKISF